MRQDHDFSQKAENLVDSMHTGKPERTAEQQRKRVALYMWFAARNCRDVDGFGPKFRKDTASTASKGAAVLEASHPALASRLAERAAKLASSGHWGAAPRNGLAALFAECAIAADPDVAQEASRLMQARADGLAQTLADAVDSVGEILEALNPSCRLLS